MKNLSKQRRSALKFLRLSSRQKWLLLKALVVLTVYKCLLLIVPFNRFVKAPPGPVQSPAIPSDKELSDTVWAITVVSRQRLLGFTCLVQALAAKWLLKKYPAVALRIGVRKNERDDFSAHAWVVYNDRTILGGQTTEVFRPILEWN